jgi:hypothetical protein
MTLQWINRRLMPAINWAFGILVLSLLAVGAAALLITALQIVRRL